ncbi:hypothetical protein J437_LFUL001222 [Ladona fulva]|uniref:Acyl-CoA synthetase short-chain family member 3, mitochondrial n=1 Tax=Ladona fulva TaxID=123851 RepID=A0A8K0JVZ7_LADFU|nr:hypothetical protein J437_LFUL001222 [Ladona fulva]
MPTNGHREENEESLSSFTHENEIWAVEYDRAFKNSLENPEEFWAEIGHELTWFKPWDKVMDNTNPPFTKWFVGGMLNACYNAVDRHVENGHGERIALIHDSPVTSTIHHITYSQLLDKVSRLAGVYSSIGVMKGDRVLIYMPMIPEAIISMLATARLGAIHSVVFGGFAARELRTRIEHAEPTVIVAASCGVEPNKIIRYRCILQEALSHSKHKPTHVIMYERPEITLEYHKSEGKYFEEITELDWEESLQAATPHECIPVEANDPLYILYTSGTTDQPKGVVRPVGGHLATLCWTMHAVYGMKPPKKSPISICNGEAPENCLLNTSEKFEHSDVAKGTQASDSIEQQDNDRIITSSISETDEEKELSVSNQSKNWNLINSNACRVKNEQVISAKYVEPMENGDDIHFLPEVKVDCEGKTNDQDSLVNISSTPTSNNILSKVCMKMRQLITGMKEKKSNESISYNHKSLNESLNEVISSGNIDHKNPTCTGHSSKILESGNLIIKDGQLAMGEHKNENLSQITGLDSKEDVCIFGEVNNVVANIVVSKSLKIPLQKSNCHLKNADVKSLHLTNEFSQETWDPNQEEIFQIHDGCLYNQFSSHYPNHLQIGKRKSDLNVKPEEKCDITSKIKSKNSHSTLEKSHKLPRCKSKIKSLNDESQYNQSKVWWAASDMGWVVGHSYVCYAPLTAGLTSVMYEGKPDRTPDPGQYFRVIQQHRVNAILTAPTALRVIKRVDPNAVYGKQYSTDSLETIFVAGENLDQSTKAWAEKTFKVDVVNHWWQTETGHSITATCIGLGHSSKHPPGLSTGKPFPVRILRDDGSEAAIGEEGRIAARLPLPPGTLSTLYKNPEMFNSLDSEEDVDAAQRISSDLICMVRELVGPIAAFRLASPVPALPKTRSGKIPRKSVARMARGLPLKV